MCSTLLAATFLPVATEPVKLIACTSRLVRSAAAVELKGKSLFPEVHELHDPLGDPPEPKGYW